MTTIKCQALDKKFFQTYTGTVSGSRQEEAEPKRGRGRPRQYPKGKVDGAPQVTVRFTPELVEWIKERGGAVYIRELVETDRDQSSLREKNCSQCGKAIEAAADRIDVRVRGEGVNYFHLECALPLLRKR